jgi:hypothetical protein
MAHSTLEIGNTLAHKGWFASSPSNLASPPWTNRIKKRNSLPPDLTAKNLEDYQEPEKPSPLRKRAALQENFPSVLGKMVERKRSSDHSD